MTYQELEAIVAGNESEQVEFKRTTGQRTEGGRTVCAMLNGSGGFVLFGVTDEGDIRGQQLGANTLEDVVAVLRQIEPAILLQPETIPLTNGNEVIALRVPGAEMGPFTYDGRPYMRQGPTTVVMPQEEYRRRLLEQMQPTHRWETQPAHEVRLQDLDSSEITRTVEEAVRRGRLEDPGTRDIEELIRGLGLIKDDRIVNAAVVLFARQETLLPHYPQCLLRMARFRGNTPNEFEDNRQVHGNAFALLQQAQRFLRDHLPVAGKVVPDLFERRDDPLYPLEALREALANALCHRDYQLGGGSISIGIFDNRLEISSTGRLPFGLTVEDLTRPHPSRPWNPLIASVFYRRGLIEQWGRGTLRITELIEEAGLATPEFEEGGGEVVVRFFPTGYVPPRRIDHPLTTLQQQVLEVLARSGPALLSEIRSAIPEDVPKRTIQYNLQTLRELDLVELTGWGRGARWHLSRR